MTEEELRATCKDCRKVYPYVGCRGCPNYVDVELVQHEQRQNQADGIAELEAELEQAKRERDAAVKDLKSFDIDCNCCIHAGKYDDCDLHCERCAEECECAKCRNNSRWQWHGVKEG